MRWLKGRATPLAIRNLLHQRWRTLVAASGVAFALVLIFLQLGFFGAVESTATTIYDRLEFDLILVSRRYQHFYAAHQFPRTRLSIAQSVDGVQAVRFLDIGNGQWRSAASNARSAARRVILILGCDPGEAPFRDPHIRGILPLLDREYAVALDRRSRPEFGAQEVGAIREVSGQEVEIAALFSMGTGFGADGAILTSDMTFHDLALGRSPNVVSLGLIGLAPGADPQQIASNIRAVLPEDVTVWTRQELESRERRHWVQNTSVGIIFLMGVVVAFVVGVVVVYQVLSSDIANHLGEYATLKAMGFSNRQVEGVVLTQAAILAVLGFVPGYLLTLLLYAITRGAAHVPIEMTTGRVALVFFLALAMCLVSGLVAVGKVRAADPADLFG